MAAVTFEVRECDRCLEAGVVCRFVAPARMWLCNDCEVAVRNLATKELGALASAGKITLEQAAERAARYRLPSPEDRWSNVRGYIGGLVLIVALGLALAWAVL